MAELLGYSLINGSAMNYSYYAEVESQEDIESHRKELESKHNLEQINSEIVANNNLLNTNDDLYEICFTLRKPIGSKLYV